MQQPFVGAAVLGSAVSMDKQAMKAAFAAADLAQVPYVCVQASELEQPAARKGCSSGSKHWGIPVL